MAINIEGFTPLQQELADKICAMENPEQVVEFFNTLPRSLLMDAYVVYRMIIEAAWDDMDLGECAEANEIIDYIRNIPC